MDTFRDFLAKIRTFFRFTEKEGKWRPPPWPHPFPYCAPTKVEIFPTENTSSILMYLKEKENSIIFIGFLLEMKCPMGSTYCVMVWDIHFDIVTLYLMHIHQPHSYMHIKEQCITVCVNCGSY